MEGRVVERMDSSDCIGRGVRPSTNDILGNSDKDDYGIGGVRCCSDSIVFFPINLSNTCYF